MGRGRASKQAKKVKKAVIAGKMGGPGLYAGNGVRQTKKKNGDLSNVVIRQAIKYGMPDARGCDKLKRHSRNPVAQDLPKLLSHEQKKATETLEQTDSLK
tara:strand:+ start:367 stop:666 length:300 start_codon:yes stop_codon:yes gene_type:complete